MAATSKETTNFMDGKSYKLDPLQTLKLVATSMICGESQYYRRDKKVTDIKNFLEHLLFPEFYQESTVDYFDKIVADALDFDFEGSLKFVDKLRNEYFMRLNSNALLVKAAHHPKRAEFNKANPLVFKRAIESVGCLPTDWTTQFKLLKESGKPIPTIWKRAIASKLQSMSNYHAAKYLHGSKTQGKVKKAKTPVPEKSNDSVEEADQEDQQPEQPDQEEQQKLQKRALANLTDLIRVTHPNPTETIIELVKTGKVTVADDDQTWEKLRSAGKTWKEINAQIRLPHMALLRNLRNIAEEYARREDSIVEMRELIERLVNGVKGGKQFPFRYFSAYKMIKDTAELNDSGRRSHKKPQDTSAALTPGQQKTLESLREMVLEGLNRCVLESVECIPEMKGRVDCLSDNSGSSRHGMVSEYGTVNIFEIANLSAILTAYRSTEGGSVWVFGDRLIEYPVTKDQPILKQLEDVNALGDTVGQGTETGIWLFWEKFIAEKRHLDTVFIYSDMQAGTGGLYVEGTQKAALNQMGAGVSDGTHVDVLKLVDVYRQIVFPKVNVFSVQVAGYDNSVLPDILYRGAVLSGWTGKEAKLAYELVELWDQVEGVSPSESAALSEGILEEAALVIDEEEDGWVSDW